MVGLLGDPQEGSSSEEDEEGGVSGSEGLHSLAEEIALKAVSVLQQAPQVWGNTSWETTDPRQTSYRFESDAHGVTRRAWLVLHTFAG